MYEAVYYASTLVSSLTFVTLIAGTLVFKQLRFLRYVYMIMLTGYCIVYTTDILAVSQGWIPWMKVQTHPPIGVIYNGTRQLAARITIFLSLATPLYQYWKAYGRG